MITPLDLAPIISCNPTLAHPLFVALLASGSADTNLPSPFLDILPYLAPTLSTFDLMGRLLREGTAIAGGHLTVAELVRADVLGRFIHESINWLDHAEMDEREGRISDDRFAKGAQNVGIHVLLVALLTDLTFILKLCRFYNSLIKLGIVDPARDDDTAEMAHFSLRNSRFEDANALYRVLATGRF